MFDSVSEASTVAELKSVLADILSTLPDDLDNDANARKVKEASRALTLAGGKLSVAAKSYFRGY